MRFIPLIMKWDCYYTYLFLCSNTNSGRVVSPQYDESRAEPRCNLVCSVASTMISRRPFPS